MSKPPRLHVVEGGAAEDERRVYRLREARPHAVPAEEAWPKDGEWRALIRRLMRNPVKP